MGSICTAAVELKKLANEVETLDMNSKEASSNKISALIEPGQRIVCLNPVQGIYKGRSYVADQYFEPGVLVINELSGEPVGAFHASRFCIDNSEY